eukprot:6491032-Pyramimonas_sp.AAC.1
MLRTRELRAAGLQIAVDIRESTGAEIRRAVVSHVRAQADGTRSFLSAGTAGSRGLLVTSTMDDADMWVRRPPRPHDPDEPHQDKDQHEKKRGRNKRTTFLNLSQVLHVVPLEPQPTCL